MSRILLAIPLLLVGCTAAPVPALSVSPAASPAGSGASPGVLSTPSKNATPRANVRDLEDIEGFAELAPGTYSLSPGDDPQNSMRVFFTVAASGWAAFLGAFKPEGGAEGRDTGHRYVAVNFYDVKNVVVDACKGHAAASPPIGPTVDDLANAAAALSPFELASPPTDVTAYGYSGKHLELTLPEVPHEFSHDRTVFHGCSRGYLNTWIAPPLGFAFYGYYGPRQREEIWILDVEGRRLMIDAISSAESPAEDIAEMRQILESIEIEP